MAAVCPAKCRLTAEIVLSRRTSPLLRIRLPLASRCDARQLRQSGDRQRWAVQGTPAARAAHAGRPPGSCHHWRTDSWPAPQRAGHSDPPHVPRPACPSCTAQPSSVVGSASQLGRCLLPDFSSLHSRSLVSMMRSGRLTMDAKRPRPQRIHCRPPASPSCTPRPSSKLSTSAWRRPCPVYVCCCCCSAPSCCAAQPCPMCRSE